MIDSVQSIENLINQINLFFLSSVDQKGFPNTKAMLSPRKREGLHTFYFTTALSSKKAIQFSKNPNANLYFCNPQTYDGVMLLGTAEVLTEPKLKEELWREGDSLYHPLGVTDPDYCVIKFTADNGRFYSNLKSEDFLVI
jgi:general stress protein 26